MDNNTELTRIPVFVRVVEAGSFSAAARALGIPKSSASRGVRQLEEHLGVRLLQRTTRRLRLTEAGQQYYHRVASALAGLEDARAAVAEIQDAPKGLVRLVAPSNWGSWVLAPIVARFIERHPGIRIELTNRDIDLVRDGFDLALKVGRLADSSLIVRPIGAIDRGLFATAQYLARRGTPRRLPDLTRHDFLACGSGGSASVLKLEGPSGPESVTVSGPVVSNEDSFVKEAVRLHLGIGLLPTSGCPASLGLVRVLADYSEPGVAYSLVYPSARYVPHRVALLRDALLAELPTRMAVGRGEPACGAARTLKGQSRRRPAGGSVSRQRRSSGAVTR